MTEIYFDNSATTQVLDSVCDMVVRAMKTDYGNPSSKHQKGVDAENLLKEARIEIAKTLKVQEKEILFTSGGTESNNMALFGAAFANKRAGNHIITTAIEHAAVYQPLQVLEQAGFRVTYLPVDHNGRISLEDLDAAICDDTILVSVMYVNNEIGAVEPIEEIGEHIKRRNSNILFHVDAIQAYGKYQIRPKRMKIDLMSVSGHKIHGPKGIGFLYMREGIKVKPLVYGGGQQKGMRSGTDNVAGAVGLGEAAKEAYTDFEKEIEHLYCLKDRMTAGLLAMDGVCVHGLTDRTSAPHIVSAGFKGVRSEVLLHALEERGIYVSSGSACSSNHPGVSGALKGIGVHPDYLDSTIRFSFSRFNTEEEVDECLKALQELLPFLRRYQRG